MTDQKPTPETIPPAAPKRRSRTPFVIAGVLTVGIAGVGATAAFSQGGFGPGGWRQGPGHWGGQAGARGMMDPAQMDARIERAIKHLAIEIDATPDQQTKLITIAKGAAKDLVPVRAQMNAAREKGRALLVSPTLDRAAIEAFRAEQVALADQVSKRVAQAVGDVTEVLTPAQRIKVASRLPGLGMPGMGGGRGGPGRHGMDHNDHDRRGPNRHGDMQGPGGMGAPDRRG